MHLRTHYHAGTNRFWLHNGNRTPFKCDWSFLGKATHCGLELGFRKGFRSPKLFLGIPLLINLWMQINDVDEWEDYECGFSIHSGAFWVKIFNNPLETSSRDPWYRKQHNLNFKDFLLGREKHTTETIGTEEVKIPMPEGSYPGVAKLEVCTWKRPRWPKALVKKSVWIDCKPGVPFPGKGENSWDCGMDAICGTGHSGHSVEEAIGHYVAYVLTKRRRYGGKNWECSYAQA